jgi:predicted dehydrogenase
MKKISCSIVGLGRIGSLLEDDTLREKPASHAGAIIANSHCKLLSGCDINPGRCRLFKKRWNCHHVFLTVDEMIVFRKPDILHIATPPDTHKELVEKAVNADIPLVICEKPLTKDIREAEEIVRLTSESKTVLIVNHERRYSLDYLHLKKIIDRKKYGELLSLNCRLFMGQGHTVEELLWEDGTHMIDIIRFLSGCELVVGYTCGKMREKGGECLIALRAGDIYVVIDAACNRNYIIFELDAYFRRGMVRIGNGVYEEYKSDKSPYYEHMRSLYKRSDRLFEKTNYFAGMLQDAVSIFLSRGMKHKPISKGIDGYMAVRVIHEIITSHHTDYR